MTGVPDEISEKLLRFQRVNDPLHGEGTFSYKTKLSNTQIKKKRNNTLTSIFLAVYLILSVHAKTLKLLCEILYKSLVRPSLWAKNLQQKHVCLHMRVSSPVNLCNCSCPAVHAGLQHVHMSRPTFVWLVLKQRGV